ncbi:transketolase [Neomegalonema sp.]|uniref:transketolase n=1 Tax=Neomegalonema sp. TaxID=2039713 RepID=UPI00262C2590|nr:transketolase [Neomegalonema sp.]MDD2869470.1 transketolase [Neomegalonema sp.]
MVATPALMANAIRFLAADAVEAANSGHPGMPMGMADVATVLFTRHIKLDPARPDWPDRDRFVLSAGHGSMLQYAVQHLLGYADMTLDQIRNFRQLGAITAGHPEYGHAEGIETTTGPLGQGIATAVGLALGERMMNARFGDDLVGHFTYVIAGDGCLMEGISHEAIDLAGHLKLGRLIVLWDDNSISIDGATDLSTSTDQRTRFAAAGWDVIEVDGHDQDAVDAALESARAALDKPTLVACKTVIGKGAPTKSGTAKVHGSPLGAEELAGARKALGWSWGPFEIPEEALKAWRGAGERSRAEREAWEKRLAASPKKAGFEAAVSGALPADFGAKLGAYKALLLEEKPKVATRKASEMALTAINAATPLTIGGSADLTGSNLTLTKGMGEVKPGDYAGRYVYYGVREHGMAAAMNGLALHGGFIPYGGTFLVFAGYMAGAMRLSALMGLRVIYVLTHDSIGLGEDGPTHQPVETLATLRALPNMLVFRPADAVETAEAWEIALAQKNRPSVLALSRQNLPLLRDGADENLTARGGYVLREAEGGARDVTLIATGSEVEIALAGAAKLEAEGIRAAVVSMPSQELFAEQDEAWQAKVLGSAPRVAVEAAVEFGWSRFTQDSRNFVGMKGFGASAPAGALYKHFGIDADHVAARAKEAVARRARA